MSKQHAPSTSNGKFSSRRRSTVSRSGVSNSSRLNKIASIVLNGPMGEGIAKAHQRRYEEIVVDDEDDSDQDDSEKKASSRKKEGDVLDQLFSGDGGADKRSYSSSSRNTYASRFGGLHGPIHLAWGRALPSSSTATKTPTSSPSSAPLATTFRKLEGFPFHVTSEAMQWEHERRQAMNTISSFEDQSPRELLLRQGVLQPHIYPSSNASSSVASSSVAMLTPMVTFTASPAPPSASADSNGLLLSGASFSHTPTRISFSPEEYASIGLDGDSYQPIASSSFSSPSSVGGEEGSRCYRFSLHDTQKLFDLADTYGPSNMSVADRMWLWRKNHTNEVNDGTVDGSSAAAPRAFILACSHRYYACARAVMRYRLALLERAASAGGGNSVGDVALTPTSNSNSNDKSSAVEGAVSLLVAALSQHPILVTPSAATAAASSSTQGGATPTAAATQLSSPPPFEPVIATSSTAYNANYEAAARYHAKLAAQAPIQPPPSTDGHNHNANGVMAFKARRVFNKLAASVANCQRRIDEDPSLPLLIATIEDRATAQYEAVLEGVRDGVYANTGSSATAAVTVSPSPYTIGAPDLASAEHLLLTMNTKNATKAGAAAAGGGGGSGNAAKKEQHAASSSLMSMAAGAAAGENATRKSVAAAGVKRGRDEDNGDEGKDEEGQQNGSQCASMTAFLQRLLNMHQAEAEDMIGGGGGGGGGGASSSNSLTMPPAPALPIPSMLHLELEDKLEEVLLTDPLALNCSCDGCYAAMAIVRSRLMRCVLMRRALSRMNITMGMAQRLCIDELGPVLGAEAIEAAVVARDVDSSAVVASTAAQAAAAGGSSASLTQGGSSAGQAATGGKSAAARRR